MNNMPPSMNSYKLLFINNDNFPVTIRGYMTLFCTFKEYQRQTHQTTIEDLIPKPGPSTEESTDSLEMI